MEVSLPAPVVQDVVNYLTKQPYGEVAKLMGAIFAALNKPTAPAAAPELAPKRKAKAGSPSPK